MMKTFKILFGLGSKVDYKELIRNGAIIIDVRTKNEFAGGNVEGSVNIPLEQLSSGMKKLKDKEKTIITCCASGIRSASAKAELKSMGFKNVHNGGSWYNLQ